MAHPYFLEAKQLQYAYQKHQDRWVLNKVDLSVRQDEFLLICGASGAGKSTLCRTFNGLIPHFYDGRFIGEVRVAGKSTLQQSVGTLFRQVGMVFQNPEAQLFNRTVKQEIAFGLESLGLPGDQIERRTVETAKALNITQLLSKTPHELSGGEQQLVSIAAIVALHPRLLVLDEPYAHLDPLNVQRVRETLREIHHSGLGVLICEHRLALTAPDVQRMVVLQRGRIVLDGKPQDILNRKLSRYGLEAPLAARIGRRMGVAPVPLSLESLKKHLSDRRPPSDMRPDSPEPISSTSPAVLEVDHVSFSLKGKAILKDISFTLHRGECLAVVGANGAGKTVLLKHLNGLYRPSSGRVIVMGKDSRNLKVSQLARLVAVAFQNPNSQFFRLSVWEEIIVSAKVLDCYDDSWILELVKLFHLESMLTRAPFRLSGGEKKRVAFAAALAAKPVILALDEPTAGQGWYFRRALGQLLTKLRQMGQAVILVTHDLGFAEQHSHRWLLLSEGRIVAQGHPWEVMKNRVAMEQAHLEPTDAFQLWAD
ncbi:MAG: ATP-binding cassette domain-containing protein [Deltaproteobacteria bacterium]|nr:ATP-binding cassette domain-containing protein [Deltaproteobacteria bacterium]MBW1994433.1 ATP-binding cassette domain-containing protein [Deltaproteobacteria bacterium]